MTTASPAPRLTRHLRLARAAAGFPDGTWYELPEKILEFGTGAFLRGFSNVYVDRAIRGGRFGGRIVAVGSTGSGRADMINGQDGLYTVCIQGLENGDVVDRCTIVGSVSRAIASTDDWKSVRAVACSPDLEFVVSNTTEVGIRLDTGDRPDLDPPTSFPGKLTALLHERAEAFAFDPDRGLTILCCELVEDNAQKLRSIVLQLADRWEMGDVFTESVRRHNRFCNTLVDRIVPGRPDPESAGRLERRLGYADELLVQAEPYSLWAVEGDDALRERLTFLDGAAGVVVLPDISPYRTRKVRILNGAHTAMVPISYLCGNDTVAETMDDPLTSAFVRQIILDEIVPTLEVPDAAEFAHQVLDRFANPFVQHRLLSIALQQTSKMDVRVVPSLKAYVEDTGRIPDGLTLGFAAFLLLVAGGGRSADLPDDDRGEVIRACWQKAGPDHLEAFVRSVCEDRALWHVALDDLPGFVSRVASRLRNMHESGVRKTLKAHLYSTNEHS